MSTTPQRASSPLPSGAVSPSALSHRHDHANVHAHFNQEAKPEAENPSDGSVTQTEGRHDGSAPASRARSKEGKKPAEGAYELEEEDCYDELGYSFPSWKKWTILTIIFLVQTSMNFNTSLYSNGLGGISDKFGVSAQAARCGAMIFLVFYAFGCELWAPWSEEFGRRPILQASLFLVNIWCLPVALAPNFGSLLVGRALGGLSSAGGSVTLGMVADLFDSDEQQYAVAYIVFSSVGGSILGPIIGGFCEQYLAWRWTIWIQLIFGGFVQVLHFFCVPETRSTVMMDRIARRRRKSGQDPNVYGPNEMHPWRERLDFREIMWTWARPFYMFITEPIVSTLSLLSGFSDALIFMQIQSFSLVYKQWGFNAYQTGLSFIPIGVGYVISWLVFCFAIRRMKHKRKLFPHDEKAQYEARLDWLLWTAPCLPIGLAIFAATTEGPPIHWIGSMFGSALIGIANYAIYGSTIDYMICAYGPYSASATGGNGFARDFLAGVLTIPATPFYTNIGKSRGGSFHLQIANGIMAIISAILVVFVYIIHHFGPQLRKRSPFAQSLAAQAAQQAAELETEAASRPATPGGAATPTPRRPRVARVNLSYREYATPQHSRRGSRRNSFADDGGADEDARRNSIQMGDVRPRSAGGLAGRPQAARADSYDPSMTPRRKGQLARQENDLIREATQEQGL